MDCFAAMSNNNGTHNNNNNNTTHKLKRGVDSLLISKGRALKVGEEVRFTLVKGPDFALAPDPVNPKAPYEQFPLVAKFPESVVKPNLQQSPWNTARLYQQDVPKAQDDSDEEQDGNVVKKRWRARKELPKRQWILQEQVDFLETMMAKRQRKALPKDQISSRYEGIPEHNPSQYALLEVPTMNVPNIQVTTLPTPQGTIAFSQPKGFKTLSMTEAELAIEDQRGKMTRFMMHDKQMMLQGKQTQNESKKRLFSKLVKKKRPGEEDEEAEDDIMGDLAFRNRKGSGKARKELLNSLGDSGLKVDQDGVLGGNNDGMFGRGKRFGRFQANQEQSTFGKKEDNDQKPDSSTKGNDGLAMADDFYQRDVQAEYEELDYDVNEQFDDDDVDVGETEVVVEGGGFADEDEDDDLDDDDLNGDKPAGAEGLASLSGFRLMLAKARGEITPEQIAEAAEKEKQKKEEEEQRRLDILSRKRQDGGATDDSFDPLANIYRPKEPEVVTQPEPEPAAAAPAASPVASDTTTTRRSSTGVKVDEHGLRVIDLDSVRREIWLRNGQISTKQLMKIFSIKKKTAPERKTRFNDVVKELCTIQLDAIGTRMLVLKQHYSQMG